MATSIGYLLLLVAANIASAHWPPLSFGGLLVPAGTVFAGACLTARDLLHEALGPPGVVVGILAGTAVSAALASPRIALACVVAFTVSEALDTLVYARLRHRGRLGAVAGSNAAGVVVDSLLFVPLAFGGPAAVPGQIAGKAVATLLSLTVLYATGAARRAGRP
ncbi:VUT family protein [Saccharothrix xinjiangensis]|uniref:VUT family protein n=1 Tax=Saccharothrix xinjiangensis TaxID=204798 RepID=A0ABV9YDT4_9PSEU